MTPQEVADRVAANMMEALGLRLGPMAEKRNWRAVTLFEYGDDNQLLRVQHKIGNLWHLGLVLSKRQPTPDLAESTRYFSWYTGWWSQEELLALRLPEDVKAIVELMKGGE